MAHSGTCDRRGDRQEFDRRKRLRLMARGLYHRGVYASPVATSRGRRRAPRGREERGPPRRAPFSRARPGARRGMAKKRGGPVTSRDSRGGAASLSLGRRRPARSVHRALVGFISDPSDRDLLRSLDFCAFEEKKRKRRRGGERERGGARTVRGGSYLHAKCSTGTTIVRLRGDTSTRRISRVRLGCIVLDIKPACFPASRRAFGGEESFVFLFFFLDCVPFYTLDTIPDGLSCRGVSDLCVVSRNFKLVIHRFLRL